MTVHWDDDDWQAPHRLRYQIEQLDRHGAEICGLSRVLHFDPRAGRAWLFAYPRAGRRWVAGNSLCYTRSLWLENCFPAQAAGEDTRFLRGARMPRPLLLSDHRIFAALIHPGNTVPVSTSAPFWRPCPLGDVRDMLGSDWLQYARLDAVSMG